jgi:hypothetical protein
LNPASGIQQQSLQQAGGKSLGTTLYLKPKVQTAVRRSLKKTDLSQVNILPRISIMAKAWRDALQLMVELTRYRKRRRFMLIGASNQS